MKNNAAQLYSLLRKRIMTTMIGALASLEEFEELFEEEEYEKLRTDILDKGHQQIDKMGKDLELFEIKAKTVYFMPLRRKDNGQD